MSDSVEKYFELLESGGYVTEYHSKKDPIVEAVRFELDQRSRQGMLKYKTTLEDNDLDVTEWLQHTKEELLDAACYIQKLILEIKKERTDTE